MTQKQPPAGPVAPTSAHTATKATRRGRKPYFKENSALRSGTMSAGELAELLLERGASPVWIKEQIDRYAATNGEVTPSLRKLQLDAKEDHPGVELWSLQRAEPATVPILLETLAVIIEETGGALTSLTVAESAWVLRVQAAAPELSPWHRYLWARRYIDRTAAQADSTVDLDAVLAFRPWRGEGEQRRYEGAVEAGSLPVPPFKLFPAGESDVIRVARERTALRPRPNQLIRPGSWIVRRDDASVLVPKPWRARQAPSGRES